MEYKVIKNLEDFEAWGGGADTLKRLKINTTWITQVENFIGECMQNATETDINDFLWFEDEYIIEDILGITEDEFYEIEMAD